MGEAKRKRDLMQATREMQHQFYAALGLALHRKMGYGQKRIMDVFGATQEVWDSYEGAAWRMRDDLREETGIVLKGADDAAESERG